MSTIWLTIRNDNPPKGSHSYPLVFPRVKKPLMVLIKIRSALTSCIKSSSAFLGSDSDGRAEMMLQINAQRTGNVFIRLNFKMRNKSFKPCSRGQRADKRCTFTSTHYDIKSRCGELGCVFND